jgi:hypothetical protein
MAEESSLKDPEIQACLARIEGARKRLSLVLSHPGAERLMNPLDWRAWFRDYPVESTLGAVAAGFLLGGDLSSSRGDGGGLLEELTRKGMEAALRFLVPPF